MQLTRQQLVAIIWFLIIIVGAVIGVALAVWSEACKVMGC